MRRSLFPVTTAGAALLLLSVVSASDARAQDLTPPPPMDPAAPGAPSADPNAPATAPTAEQATTEKLDEAEH
jgi:hypothetical protein